MKKIFSFVVCCITMLTVISCGSNSSTKNTSVTGADGTVFNSYQTACSKGDFDAARDYIRKMKENLAVVKDGGDDKEIKTYSELIQEAEEYVENAELQFLASLNEEQANTKILLLIQQPIEGVEAAEMSCVAKGFHEQYLNCEIDELSGNVPAEFVNYRRYMIWCGKHNSRCSTILSIAIACGNQSLAQKLIYCFRPDPELRLEGIKKYSNTNTYHYYDAYAHYTNASKDAAQKKYDEAVKSGAFVEK